MSFNHTATFNGTFGEIWIDGTYVAQCEACTAEVSKTYADIRKPNDRATYKKLLSEEGSGSMTLYKVNSSLLKKAGRTKTNGRQIESQIIIKVDDPDATGFERILLKNVNFENVPLTSFERAAETKEEISFFFSNWEPLDYIDEELYMADR